MRAMYALEVGRAKGGPTLVVTASTGVLRQAAEALGHAVLGALLIVPEGQEGAEQSLRLTEIESSVYSFVAVTPAMLWQTRLARTILSWHPILVVLDAGALAVDPLENDLQTLATLLRIRALLPQVFILILAGIADLSLRGALVRELGGAIGSLGPPLPPKVILQAPEVASDKERVSQLAGLVAAQNGTGLIMTPSRRTAATVAAALQAIGHNAAAYHTGLNATEQLAILEAFRDGRQRLLVGTEALLDEDELPVLGFIAFSHPPRSLFSLARLADRLELATRQALLVVVYTTADLQNLKQDAIQRVPSRAQVRDLYRLLRRQAVGAYVLATTEMLLAALSGSSGSWQPSLVRSGLILLERAGYIRRHPDFARAATITLTPANTLPPNLIAALHLHHSVPAPVDPLQVAKRLRLQPHILLQRLLEAESEGQLTVRMVGRHMLFSLLNPGHTAAERLTDDLEEILNANATGVDAVMSFLQSPTCRLQALAIYTQTPPPDPCGLCDRCNTINAATAAHRAQWEDLLIVALNALAGVPLGMRSGAVPRAIQSALVAAGRSPENNTVETIFQELRRRDLLESRAGALGDLLVVSTIGYDLLAANGYEVLDRRGKQ